MRESEGITELRPEHIDALLEFLPLFERKEFRAYVGAIEGNYIWHQDLERFHEALYTNNWIAPFAWMDWQQDAQALVNNPSLLAEADMETLRKLLTTLARQEHFTTNVFPIACEDGTLLRILRRVQQLREGVAAG